LFAALINGVVLWPSLGAARKATTATGKGSTGYLAIAKSYFDKVLPKLKKYSLYWIITIGMGSYYAFAQYGNLILIRNYL